MGKTGRGVLAMAAWASTLGPFVSAVAAAGEAPSVYPPPVGSMGGALTACPNPVGLERFTAGTRTAARRAALRYGRVSLAVDLADSDRAWQPSVRAMWKGITGTPPGTGGELVRKVQNASANGYRVIVGRSCGQALVRRSLIVTVGPRPVPGTPPCEACAESVFFVARHGHALIYFVY